MAALGAPAPAAHASLLGGAGGLLGGVVGTVNGLVGVLTAGWDDGATTAPTTMSQVNATIGATSVWNRGFDGDGVGVAQIDSGVAPVEGLTVPGKVTDGPDLSFESQSADYQHLDTYGHGTHMAGIIAGRDPNVSDDQLPTPCRSPAWRPAPAWST